MQHKRAHFGSYQKHVMTGGGVYDPNWTYQEKVHVMNQAICNYNAEIGQHLGRYDQSINHGYTALENSVTVNSTIFKNLVTGFMRRRIAKHHSRVDHDINRWNNYIRRCPRGHKIGYQSGS